MNFNVIDNAPTIKALLTKDADGVMKHFFDIIEYKTQEFKNSERKPSSNSSRSEKPHHELDQSTWYQKALQHSLKNALIAALVENIAQDLENDNKLNQIPPSHDEIVKVDRNCAEWGISTATYQFQEWMHLFNNTNDIDNGLSPKDLPKSIF